MKIRTAIFIELEGWTIIFKDDSNTMVHCMAIPPTTGNRIDVLVETREENGFHIVQKYLYNFQGKVKKLKGEKIIITIINGIPSIVFSEK